MTEANEDRRLEVEKVRRYENLRSEAGDWMTEDRIRRTDEGWLDEGGRMVG